MIVRSPSAGRSLLDNTKNKSSLYIYCRFAAR